MKHRKILAAVCAALLLLSGCAGGMSASKNEAAMDMAMPESAAPEAPMEAPQASIPMSPEYSVTVEGGGSVYERPDAKLIRRCTVELQTTEFDTVISALYGLVDSYGGYFENSSVYGGGYYNANARRSGEYVVRVPAENYGAFRSSVGELGYVSFSNESTEDIGEQYYDTEARLKTLRTKQDRLLTLLEKAETMEDIIKLESALGEVEYEIELYSSTLNRYDGLVNFATFHINVHEVIRVEEKAGEADSLTERMSSAFGSGLDDLKDNVEDFMVWASYHVFGIAGWIVVIAVAATVIRRRKWSLPKPGKKKSNSEDA